MSDAGTGTRRVRGRALLIISVLLIASATLRIGVQAETSLTRNLPDAVADMEKPKQTAEQSGETPADLQILISALRNREQQLNRREIQIEDRMKALEIVDEAIDRKLAALISAEEQLSATLVISDGASEGDLARLTDVYEKMKPKDAAAMFEEMAPEFAAGFLGRMRPEAAANVMAGLSPKMAYAVSVILAGRNALAPKE